jgi:hypothetical protein
MRVAVAPIVEQAIRLSDSIYSKSKSRSSSAAYNLLCSIPDPTWAETAPGCTIWYNGEQELAQKIEGLRYVALTWLRALIDPSKDLEPSAKWPEPENLIQATRELAAYAPCEASNG